MRDEPITLVEVVVPTLGPSQRQQSRLRNGALATLTLSALDQDDCAAYRFSGDQILVAGSDYVRGPKFQLYEQGLLSNYDIGWYLAGANLSDVAAMGAVPLGLLSVIRYPKTQDESEFRQILEGIRDCCSPVGALNVGGDIGSAERLILSASAFGVVEPESLLPRSAAKLGQIVCLTGATGLAGSVMKLSMHGRAIGQLGDTNLQTLLGKWRRVQPRFSHGRLFAESPGVTACIDTSDGLKGALEQLARASGVGMIIDSASLPIHAGVTEASTVLDLDPLELVFGDSVDFELVCTVDPDAMPHLERTAEQRGLTLHPIGLVEEGAGVVVDGPNGRKPVIGREWRHV